MLFWLDIETTGLDPEYDRVLEVYARLTDDNLDFVDHFHAVISHTGAVVEFLTDVTAGMHEALIKECLEGGVSLETVDAALCRMIRQSLTDEEALSTPLAGSSVHFDRGFAGRYLPRTMRLLSYRNVDVSSLKEVARRFWPALYAARPDAPKVHRALPDVEASIAELQHYLTGLAPVSLWDAA